MPAYEPKPYMKSAIKFMVGNGSAGLLLDPGLGKTGITYASFRVLKKKGMAERMLVIAPLRPATSTWPREAEKWHDFHDLNVHVLHGDHKEELLKQPHDVSVINPDGLAWLLGDPHANDSESRKGAARRLGVPWWDILVVDESTRFKHTNTKRFKILKPHLSRFHRRYILTGSPTPNGLMDLFGQIYILDMGGALGQYIGKFRLEYFYQTGFGGYTWLPKSDTEKRMYEKLKPLVLRMSAEDYLDLEPYVTNIIELDMPEEALKTYDQMEKLLIAQLDDGIVTAANVATATGKCRQIANGGIYADDRTTSGKWHDIHKVKVEMVQELVEELSGKPALVAYEFQHDLARLREAFPDAPYIGGGVSTKVARDVEDRWNAGALPVLLVQPKSVAHGLNLQKGGAAVIWHSIPWDLEEHDQTIRRLWRQGQEERVVVHYLAMKRTVDFDVLHALERKDKTQRSLLDALKNRVGRTR